MIGILLLNVGTPDNYDVKSVKKYLKNFLDDDNIINMNKFIRYFLVNYIICPFRSIYIAKKYKSIWKKNGSPLLVYTKKLKEKMHIYLNKNFHIEIGMIVGNPSIRFSINNIINKGCEKLVILPMFPQYSTITTGNCISKVMEILKDYKNIPKNIIIIKNFFSDSNFINSIYYNIKKFLPNYKKYYFLFSYHGLPSSNIKKICKDFNICNKKICIKTKNNFCYVSQCYQTSDLIANKLKININEYYTSFQSRFGFMPWIKPYTDIILKDIRKKNIKNIAIVCPAFTMDCLETLEEIGIKEKKNWNNLNGEKFKLIPCINDSNTWAKNLTNIILNAIK